MFRRVRQQWLQQLLALRQVQLRQVVAFEMGRVEAGRPAAAGFRWTPSAARPTGLHRHSAEKLPEKSSKLMCVNKGSAD
jgi:hypothetical protein